MSKSVIAALGLSLTLAACREPTAPEMRNIARSVEQKAKNGDLAGIREMMKYISHPYSGFSPYANVFRDSTTSNEALTVVRDGADEQVNAFVVEETFVTPDGLGEPMIRRSVFAWPTDFAFALHVSTEAHPGRIAGGPQEDVHGHIPNIHMAMLTRDTTKSWVVQSGVADISDAAVDRDCTQSSTRTPMHYVPSNTKCHWATFQVAVRGEFLTQADYRNPVRRLNAKRHRLEIQPQRLPGIRFITTCPKVPRLGDDYVCDTPIVFWRKHTQYAPSLGIDFAKITRVESGYQSIERWPDGKQREPRQVRWTAHSPDGTRIASGSGWSLFGMAETDGDLWDVRSDIPRDLRRMTMILPARAIDKDASPYGVVVVKLEVVQSP